MMNTIKVTVLQRSDDNQEVMRFLFPEELDVVLTCDEGTAELKAVFSKLLALCLEDELKIEFEHDEGYANEMYETVCCEYIKSLQSEIEQARLSMIAEGLIAVDDDEDKDLESVE